jgi:hypothetical protein
MSSARRTLQSVTVYKTQKAYPGFTLFSPMTQVPGNTWLIDMQGRLVHRWKLPGWVRLHADLLPNGNLLTAVEDVNAPPSSAPTVAKKAVEIDWDGHVVWQYDDPLMDAHDRKRSMNGNTLIMKYAEVPKEIAAKVKGGIPLGELAERVGDVLFGNVIREITPKGKIAWEWLGYEHFDPELDAIAPLQKRLVWPGINSLEELPNGDIMLCSFGCDNLFIIERKTGDIKWRWGKGHISMPHNPTLLDNGNILVLDNNRFHTQYFPPDYSRLIEVNPKTNEIEWEFKEENPVDFVTTYIGGCERLPNGNTLACEGAMGRFFEVNTMGEIVWEYIVPFYNHRDTLSPYGLSNCTFRCHRYGPDYPGLQGKKLQPEKLDLWNRLYGPQAFNPYAGPIAGETGQILVQGKAASELSQDPSSFYQESKPSSASADKKKKMESRMKRLGY